MATGTLHYQRKAFSSVNCSYVNANQMRAYNVSVPTGYSLYSAIINVAYNNTSVKVANIQLSPTDIVVMGNGFTSTDSLVLYLTWIL